jgi:hypothetical protein
MVQIGFGRNNPFPLRLGSGISVVGTEHHALLQMWRKGYDIDDDHEHSAEAYAMASGLASAWACNRRLANQGNPNKMIEQLLEWEEICSLHPSESDSDNTRRRVTAAKLGGFRRNDYEAIADSAAKLLGDRYVAYHVVDPSEEITFWPGMDPGPPGFEWTSNRAHIQIEVSRGTIDDTEFYRLMDKLDLHMQAIMPSWMTYHWHTGGDGFQVDISAVGEAPL